LTGDVKLAPGLHSVTFDGIIDVCHESKCFLLSVSTEKTIFMVSFRLRHLSLVYSLRHVIVFHLRAHQVCVWGTEGVGTDQLPHERQGTSDVSAFSE
jgi:hypothetical protein